MDRALGYEPSECVVVEDAPAGLQAAHAAGMRSIGIAGTFPEGALTTVGLFSTCCRDTRLKAGVILSGDSVGFESGMSGSPAPLLFVHGDQDHLIPIALDRRTFDAAPWPKAFLTLKREGHIDPYLKESDPGFTITAAATTDFLGWSLNGDPKALADLRAAAQVPGKSSFDDRLGT